MNNFNTYAKKLVNTPNYEDLESIVEDQLGRIWIFYSNTTSTSTVYSAPYMDISAKFTPDEGITWSNPIPVVKRAGNDLSPSALLLPNGTLLVFFDSDFGGTHDIWMTRSLDNGLNWSIPSPIVNSTDMEGAPTTFITNNGTLWLVYTKGPNGPTRDNYYVTSTDYGNSWSQPKLLLAPTSATQRGLDADTAYVTSNGTIYILVEENIGSWLPFIYKSTDNGQTWTRNQVLNGGINGAVFYNEYTNTLYEIGGSTNLVIVNSTTDGQSWSSSFTTFNAIGNHYSNAFIDNKGILWVVFSVATSGQPNLYYFKQDDFGRANLKGFIQSTANNPPLATNVQLNPLSPVTTDNLNASWNYYDADNNPQQQSRIRWYKNNTLVPALNDMISVPSSYTSKGEIWNYSIQVFDGIDYSAIVYSPAVTIINSPPTLSNVILTSPAYTTTALSSSWIFNDPDNDPQVSYSISWIKNGILQPALTGLTVSSSYTTRGDVWSYNVTVFDGTANSLVYSSQGVTILNSVPTASNLQLTSPATSSTNLYASYSVFDADGDVITATINWYKNDTLQTAFTNQTTIPYTYTNKSDVWYYNITLFDGFAYSNPFKSPVVTIQDSAPTALNISLSPSNPNTTVSLAASWIYADFDNDTQASATIRWYKNGVLQSALNDQITVSSSYTTKGESWYYVVQVSDGVLLSNAYTSNSVVILNSAPSASNIQLISPAFTNSTLSVSYTYSDQDSDPQILSGTIISWYDNGSLVPSLANSSTVPTSYTFKDQIWYYTLMVYDGSNYSVLYTSPSTTILNSPPILTYIQSTSPPINSSDITLSFTYFDADGDPMVQSSILWYKNGVHQSSLDNQMTLSNTITNIGDQWTFSIWVFDGFNTSIIYNSSIITIIPDNYPIYQIVPANTTYFTGTTGLSLSWKISDNNPTTYDLYINGVVNQTGSWSSNVNISVSLDNLPIGTYNYTLVVYDGDGYAVPSTVFVLSRNTPVAPQFSSVPTNFTFVVGTPTTITWLANDDNPTMYYLYQNGQLINSSSWFANLTIYEDLSGLQVGFYNLTLVLTDSDSLSTVATTFVTVRTAPVAPNILSAPTNFTITENTTGNVSWLVIDDNPKDYKFWVNDGLASIGGWQNGTELTLPYSAYPAGVYNFTIVFYDQDNLSSIDTFFITVLANKIPVIAQSPTNLNYYGSVTANLTWIATDDNPDNYAVYLNGSSFATGTWQSNSDINIPILNLQPGAYNFTIVVFDTAGLNMSNTIIVHVYPASAPILNTHPGDFSYQEGTVGHTVSWLATDSNPTNYAVYKDGILYTSGNWSSGTSINVNVDGLTPGSYNFTIIISNSYHLSVSDSVVITVTSTNTSSTSQISSTSQTTQTSQETSNNNTVTTSPFMPLPLLLITLFGLLPFIANQRNKRKH